jgi:2-keto-4-pentenoate hydratase
MNVTLACDDKRPPMESAGRLADLLARARRPVVFTGAGVSTESGIPDLIDFRFSGKPSGTDLIADGVYANAIVLGPTLTPVAGLDLALEGLVYEHNGAVVATNTAAEVLGNPLNSLTWLANDLGGRGLGLHAGDVVMSGSVSKLIKPGKGDLVRATFTRVGSVSARFA